MATSKEVIEHSIIFAEDVHQESVQELMDKMSQYPIVNLHFSTDGGELDAMHVLVGYLNRRYEQGGVRVLLGNHCISAGTLLLTDYIGPLYIQPTFRYFYFHAPDFLSYKLRKDLYEGRIRNLLTVYNELYYSKLVNKVGLTKKEVEKIRGGEDVYIFADDLGRLKSQFITDEFEESIMMYKPYEPPVIKK